MCFAPALKLNTITSNETIYKNLLLFIFLGFHHDSAIAKITFQHINRGRKTVLLVDAVADEGDRLADLVGFGGGDGSKQLCSCEVFERNMETEALARYEPAPEGLIGKDGNDDRWNFCAQGGGDGPDAAVDHGTLTLR